jgi:TolB protein
MTYGCENPGAAFCVHRIAITALEVPVRIDISFGIALLVGACVVSGCAGHDSPATPEVDNRLIALSSDSGMTRGSSIFLMHADGSGKIRLTGDGGFDQGPSWSPDGLHIAFDSDRRASVSNMSRVWVMDADGSNLRLLTNGFMARWSPDGTKLLYTAQTLDLSYAVYISNSDGSFPQRLTTHPTGEVQAAWSPDGRQIVFSAYPDADMNLYIVNSDGTRERRLTNMYGYSQGAAWSPDGTRIAFDHGLPNQVSALHVIGVDGTNDRTLTALGCGRPSWSPDSRQIAYQCASDTSLPQIYRMDADGSHKRALTTRGLFSTGPAWKPVE